jgi:putative ABC transport system substrate-binding protein
MKRRAFIAGLGGAAAWGPAAFGQSRPSRIGALVIGNADSPGFQKELREGLRELGRIEGRDYLIELRSAEGQLGRLPELAAELVRLDVDVIVALFTPCGRAARDATREIPIVIITGDPLGTGLVKSLSQPGANVTGLSQMAPQTHLKCAELFRDMLPAARRIGLLANGADPLFSDLLLEEVRRVGSASGIRVEPVVVVRSPEELETTFATLAKQMDAVIFQASLPTTRMVELTTAHRLPSATALREFAEIGGLMSYQADTRLLFRRAAGFVDKILRGERPAEIPIEQPTKFELVINLKTAKALGMTIPESFLLRADEVIE